MARPDLLALTPDDLALLANVGLVKRARRELASETVRAEVLDEDASGTVTVRWSDGPTCTLPAGAVLANGQCDCRAVSLCRHLIRSVLAYQRWVETRGAQTRGAKSDAAAPNDDVVDRPATEQPWDPGQISDEDLARCYKKAALTRLRKQLKGGLLVELVRSVKPVARFHGLAFSVRFLVPGDVRYTTCDCDEPAPCRHAALAVWAFRRLPAGTPGGYVSTGSEPLTPPLELLDALEAAAGELVEAGVSGLAPPQLDGLRALARRLGSGELVWPAAALDDLVLQLERYQKHDARFSPRRVAELVAELLIRADAIRADTSAVPQLLIRGAASDRAAKIGATRFVGLGCGVRVIRRAVELSAYLQDVDSGSVVSVCREILDPGDDDPSPPHDFWRLARRPAVQGVSLAALGAGQLLVQSARRTTSHQLSMGRARASFNPQTYAWDALRAPVLAEGFAEIRARLGGMPPAALRPRRVAEDFHVCPLVGVEAVTFRASDQEVQAELIDPAGERAWLLHPYTGRGREGTEALLDLLSHNAAAVRFVAGPMRLTSAGLMVHPVSLVYARGDERHLLQPWVAKRDELPGGDDGGGDEGGGDDLAEAGSGEEGGDLLWDYPEQLIEALAELLLLGLQRADSQVARAWRDLCTQGEGLGLTKLVAPVDGLADALEEKARSARWDAAPAARAALQLLVMASVAQELES